jgi:hypothetical protein
MITRDDMATVPPITRPLGELDDADVSVVGTKAATLGRLHAAGSTCFRHAR